MNKTIKPLDQFTPQDVIDFVTHSSGKILSRRFTESAMIRNKLDNMPQFIHNETSWMDSDSDLKIRIWAIVHGVKSYVTCPTCGSTVKTKTLEKWNTYCSKICAETDPNLSNIIIERRKNVDHKVANARREETMIKKYGVAYTSHRPEIIKTYRDRMRNHSLAPNVKLKLDDAQWLYSEHVTNKRSVVDTAEELGVHYGTVIDALKYNNVPYTSKICLGRNKSKTEIALAEYIQSLTDSLVETNSDIISPLTLDVFIKEKNLAFEYNGLYWHSYHPNEKTKTTEVKHSRKTSACDAVGVQLVMINENDWLLRNDIAVSQIRHKLGLSTRIYARKTQSIFVNSSDVLDFLKENQYRPNCDGDITVGLHHGGELIACMQFRKSIDDHADWEITQYTTKMNTMVVGGISKMIAKFKSVHQGSISVYVDRMYSTGATFESIGFEYKHTTKPNVYWNDKIDFIDMEIFDKESLIEEYKNINPHLSFDEIMYDQKYMKFFDCGCKLYVLL